MLRYRFGRFRLDAATRELWDGDQRALLPPRMFECLLWLIAHRDRAVGRDELVAAVWGSAEASDNVLAQIVTRLRRLIDAPGADSAIRTVPRFGYRWVAATIEEAIEAPPADASLGSAVDAGPDPAAGVAVPSRRSRVAAVFALLALAVIASAGLIRHAPAPAAADIAARPAAVLPVEVIGADAEWMRLGLMALIGDRLREAGQPVIAGESVVSVAAGAPLDPRRLADALGGSGTAPWLLATRIRAEGGRWQIRVEALGHGEVAVTTVDADPIAGARQAADALALRLGHVPPAAAAGGAGSAADERLARIDAATLAGEVAHAQTLIDAAGSAERELPALRYRAAWNAFAGGRPEQAQALFEALIADLPADREPVARARALNGLANVLYERDAIDALAAASAQALALLQGRDAPAELGRALIGAAVAATRRNQSDAAREGFAQARLALESAADPLGAARAALAAGILEKREGRLLAALPLLREAATRLAALRSDHDELLARVHLAHARLLLLEPDLALEQTARIAELSAHAHTPRARALADLTRTEILLANGRLDAAAEVLAHACAAGECRAAVTRLPFALARGRLGGDSPIEDIERALADWPLAEGDRDAGRGWLTLLRRRAGDGPAAAGRVRAAMHEWARGRTRRAETAVYASLADAEAAAAAGHAVDARSAFEAALEAAAAGQVPSDLLWAAEAYAGWLIGQGDLAGAGPVAARMAGWATRDYDAALLVLRLHHALGYRGAWHSALEQARRLAGQRTVPAALAAEPPARPGAAPAVISLAASPANRPPIK